MLTLEHSAILLTCINNNLPWNPIFGLFESGHFTQVLLFFPISQLQRQGSDRLVCTFFVHKPLQTGFLSSRHVWFLKNCYMQPQNCCKFLEVLWLCNISRPKLESKTYLVISTGISLFISKHLNSLKKKCHTSLFNNLFHPLSFPGVIE